MAPTGSKIDLYQALARQLRADSIRCSTAAGSGHPTSSLSAAADELKGTIQARVIDAYSVKPLDTGALLDAVRVTGGQLCAVEDHWGAGELDTANA